LSDDENNELGDSVVSPTFISLGEGGGTYTLGGTNGSSFDIDEATGAVIWDEVADFESNPSYVFDVIYTDIDEGSDSVSYTLTVGDITPSAPADGILSDDENNELGDSVVSPTFISLGEGGGTYTLGGTNGSSFDIDEATGAVIWDEVADFESNPSYVFDVIYTDIDEGSDSVSYTLTVGDITPSAPADGILSDDENNELGDSVVSPTFISLGEGGGTYTLGGTNGSSFDIDEATGAVIWDEVADFESNPSYVFDVIYTDIDEGSDSVSYTLTVGDIDEAPSITSATPQTWLRTRLVRSIRSLQQILRLRGHLSTASAEPIAPYSMSM
jgi:hypothetical protein